MALAPGSHLGSYHVIALIGQGGMGEVYRARDTKLGRDVALKVLPDVFADDPERLARFQREARVLASLNHPNIASIYGLEESGDTRALVLELVEGPTLAERIAQGAIPVDEALPIARQIAEALEAAHEAGVIHRDLKPANVKVKADGMVKVLDFGLAKALGPEVSGDSSESPTMTAAATRAGVIMGTAAYMSPEQAKGRPVDKRADIWAFGCVLYEMLTGQRPFAGDDVSDTLAAVLRADVDLDALPDATPARLRQVVRRCLQKDRKQRLHDVTDLRLAMDGAFETTVPQPGEAAAAPPLQIWQHPRSVALIVILVAMVTGLTVWSLMGSGGTTSLPLRRFAIDLGPASPIAGADVHAMPAWSPDGTRLVYAANLKGTPQLYLRALDQLDAQPIAGTENAYEPFFSPDGEWVGFFDPANRELKRVSVRGGTPLTLCECYPPGGATWLANGTIVLTHDPSGGNAATLSRIPEAGGTPEPLTTLDAESGDVAHFWLHPLLGGRAVLFTIANGLDADTSRVAVLSLGTGEQHVVVQGGYNARYVPTGHLIFARQGTLWGVPFDVDQLATTGPEEVVLQGIELNETYGTMALSVSGDGSLIYMSGAAVGIGGLTRSFVSVDRDGGEELLPLPPRFYSHPRLSPDGTKLAVRVQPSVLEDDQQLLWVYDVATGAALQLTNEAMTWAPVWTPDSSRIVFGWKVSGGTYELYSVPADGSGAPEALSPDDVGPVADFPTSVTPDGRTLIFTRSFGIRLEVWEMALDGSGAAGPVIEGAFSRGNAEVSPDGNWLAYRSDHSGQNEVYVQPYPGPGPTLPVSIGGGRGPVWSADGSDLYYRRDSDVMVVDVNSGSGAIEISTPRELLRGTYLAGDNREYHVAPDGRFLMLTGDAPTDGTATPTAQLILVENWFEELKRLVPVP